MDGSCWLSLLEKAWSKIHGSYELTVNGNIGDAYLIMTGSPVHVMSIDTEEESLKAGGGGNNGNNEIIEEEIKDG
jgi:hypothetical protein